MASIATATKFKLLCKPKHTWNSAVQYIDFCIENPHEMAVERRYTTENVEFETNLKKNKIYLSTHSDDVGWAGIYLHQVIVVAVFPFLFLETSS